MDAVIYDSRSGQILRTYKSLGWANRRLSKMRDELCGRGESAAHLVAATREEYNKTGLITANEMVTVTNIRTGGPVQIRRVDVGTCCDPSTERYHCM